MVLWWAFSASSAQAGELVLWHAYRGGESDAIEQAAAAWGREHDVDVTVVALPFGAFDSKIETAVPRGNGPDLFIAPHANLGKWVPMGVVQPWTAPLDAHRPVTAEAVTLDGQAWGVPLAFKSLVLLYDPEQIDHPPRTTDELVAMARARTSGDAYGLAYPATEPYFQAPWVHAFGGTTLGPDGRAHLDDQAHVDALTFARRLALDEGIAPKQPTVELVTRLYREGRSPSSSTGRGSSPRSTGRSPPPRCRSCPTPGAPPSRSSRSTPRSWRSTATTPRAPAPSPPGSQAPTGRASDATWAARP
ncbi:MAG: extracellular solute-binding protein [Bryobacterales bacterium]